MVTFTGRFHLITVLPNQASSNFYQTSFISIYMYNTLFVMSIKEYTDTKLSL